MNPSTPTLHISPATPADISTLTTLYLSAFTASSPTRRQMYAHIPPAALHAYQSEKFSKVLAQQALNTLPPSPPLSCSSSSSSMSHRGQSQGQGNGGKETHFLKATHRFSTHGSDGEERGGGEEVILALAIWIFQPDGYDEAADVAGINAKIPPGADERLWRDFAEKTGRLRSQEGDMAGSRKDEGHWLLDLLCTHPLHERKGAASKLARWAFERADGNRVKCFVEASREGHAMYARCGFQDTGAEMRVELGQYVDGWQGGVQRWWGMVREPVGDGNGVFSESGVGDRGK